MASRVIATISFVVDEGGKNEDLEYAGQLVEEMQGALKLESYVVADFYIEEL